MQKAKAGIEEQASDVDHLMKNAINNVMSLKKPIISQESMFPGSNLNGRLQ
jgi:hypothetical protein